MISIPRLRIAGAVLLLGLALAPAATATTLPDGFADSLVVGGLDFPVGFAFLPDGRLLVVEQKSARIRLIARGAIAPGEPVATLPGVETVGLEQGLLGIAADPGWPARPYLYVHLDDADGTIRVSRYTATGDLAFAGSGSLAVDPASRYDLVRGISDINPNHNGGTVRFGPDGRLYVSLGDDALFCPAQDTTSLLGKILRLDVSRLPPGSGSAPRVLVIPPGNPFAGHPDSNARLVWAMGLRNPFRFHLDPADGALHLGDVGASVYEEVDRAATGGRNFGWPLYEGPQPTGMACPAGARGDDPIYAYDRSSFTAAVIEAGVYRRPAGAAGGFPAEYEGNAFFNDYYAGFLRRLVRSGGAWAIAPPVIGQPGLANWGTGFDAVSDWLVGPDGALWYCRQAVGFADMSGQVRRIVSLAPPDTTPVDTTRGVAFLPPRPTPSPGEVAFRWTLPRDAPVEIRIFDVSGRLVRVLSRPAGAAPELRWDGTADDGARARPGLFVARFRALGVEAERRVVWLR